LTAGSYKYEWNATELTSGIYFFFTSKLKIRYTYSIWFDEGIRNLDNYHQEFLATQISVGLGYPF
jgi:hypothetical protein